MAVPLVSVEHRQVPAPAGPPARVLGHPPWMRPHPVVVGANVLIEEVLRRTRTDFTAFDALGDA